MALINNLFYMARRFKVATLLNFVGLTVALAAFYLLATQVAYNLGYNKTLPDHERIYRVENYLKDYGGWGPLVSRPVAEIVEQLPQVEGITLFGMADSEYQFKKGETTMTFPADRVNATGLATLSARLIDGKVSWTDAENDGLIIPASIATRYFGTTQAAGKAMSLPGGEEVSVRGVYDDFPDNCMAKNVIYVNMRDQFRDNFTALNFTCLVKVKENADTAQLLEPVGRETLKWVKRLSDESGSEEIAELGEYLNKMNVRYRITPIDETYFSGLSPETDRGNAAMLTVLELSALLMLLVAAINFLNFTLAESPMRIRGINTRRVLGSSRASLRLGLVGENVLVALVAALLAFCLCWLFSRHAGMRELVQGSVALARHGWIVGLTLLAALAIGIFSSVYPACYATSFPPALALKGSFGLSPRGRRLRSMLVGLQMFVAFVMVIYIGILWQQSRFIYTSDYGFDKDQVLSVETVGSQDATGDAVRQEISKITGVESVGFSNDVIGTKDVYMNWGRSDAEHNIYFACLPVDCNYLKTMGIKIIEGRDFNEHDQSNSAYIINEAARRAWDWVQMDKPLMSNDSAVVVGVCENIRFATTHTDNAATPMVFLLHNAGDETFSAVTNVRVAAGVDKVGVRHEIERVLKRLNVEGDVSVEFLDKRLEQTYQDEFRFIRQVLIFSLICLVITLIGVFCLTMFETEYRRKEIGIRKVFGSTTGEILRLFCRQYVWLIVVAFVLAAPLAYYIGKMWLQGFAERTAIHWWLFPAALVVVGGIMLLTVVLQSWKTANENPVVSIKNE